MLEYHEVWMQWHSRLKKEGKKERGKNPTKASPYLLFGIKAFFSHTNVLLPPVAGEDRKEIQ